MYILPYSIIIMFQKIANFEKKIKAKKALKNARKEAHKLNELNFLTRKNEINSSSFNDEVELVDEVTTEPTATEKIAQKTRVDSPVWRYFLRDSRKKGVVSARISKITGGKKAVWKQSKSGNKDEYVAGIEGMKSDEVDKVMAQFKNLNTYFNKSPFRAKIWSKQ